jgi:hypothetical protein
VYFYEHQLGIATNIIVKNLKIVGWTVIVEEQLVKFDLGSK